VLTIVTIEKWFPTRGTRDDLKGTRKNWVMAENIEFVSFKTIHFENMQYMILKMKTLPSAYKKRV
jgi:hypothetical protein